MSKIFFFRHAQASLGADNYDVLSKKGELQALELGKYLAKKKYLFDKIYVGSLQRLEISFKETLIDYGTIENGDNGKKTFEFKNTRLEKK